MKLWTEYVIFVNQLYTDSIPPYVATTKNEVQATVLKLNYIMSLSNLLHYSDHSRISKNAAQLPSPWFKFQCWPRLVQFYFVFYSRAILVWLWYSTSYMMLCFLLKACRFVAFFFCALKIPVSWVNFAYL